MYMYIDMYRYIYMQHANMPGFKVAFSLDD